MKKDVEFYKEKYTTEYYKQIRLDTIKKMITNKYNIKIYIMEKFRKFLNKKICQYSSEFRVPCTPMFDENFDIILMGDNYESLSVKSFSAGENSKTSLSILFASDDVKQDLYNHNSFNLLLLDEVLTNIDIHSINDILNVLKRYSQRMFVGIIAHGHGDVTTEGKSIEITKDENGSHLKVM